LPAADAAGLALAWLAADGDATGPIADAAVALLDVVGNSR
jgi:hypothetical protein